jgi:hypothetical protein
VRVEPAVAAADVDDGGLAADQRCDTRSEMCVARRVRVQRAKARDDRQLELRPRFARRPLPLRDVLLEGGRDEAERRIAHEHVLQRRSQTVFLARRKRFAKLDRISLADPSPLAARTHRSGTRVTGGDPSQSLAHAPTTVGRRRESMIAWSRPVMTAAGIAVVEGQP